MGASPRLLAASGFGLMLASMGAGFYNVPIYVAAIPDAAGVSPAVASSGATVLFLVSAAMSPLVASSLARMPSWTVAIAGGLSVAAGMLVLAEARSSLTVQCAMVLVGVGVAASGMVLVTSMIVESLEGTSHRAMLVAMLGPPAGGILVTPATQWVIANHGFGIACRAIAAFYVTVVAATAFPLGRAHRHRITIDDHPATSSGSPASSTFWWLCAICTLLLTTQTAGLTHLVALGADRAIPAASTAIAVVSVMTVVGRVLSGPLVARFRPALLLTTVGAAQVCSMLLLSQARGQGAFFAGVALLGMSVAQLIVLVPLLVADVVAVAQYTRTYGRLWFVAGTLSALGPLLLAGLHAALHGYGAAALVLAGGSLVATVMLFRGPARLRNLQPEL